MAGILTVVIHAVVTNRSNITVECFAHLHVAAISARLHRDMPHCPVLGVTRGVKIDYFDLLQCCSFKWYLYMLMTAYFVIDSRL